jgi:hypothetical protein
MDGSEIGNGISNLKGTSESESNCRFIHSFVFCERKLKESDLAPLATSMYMPSTAQRSIGA